MKLIVVLMLAALSGCAIQPVPISANYSGSAAGFGTIADANDPVEIAAASIINQAEVQLYRINRELEDRRIGSNMAISSTACVDNVKDHVLIGVVIRDIDRINQAKPMLSECKEKLERSL